MSFSTTVTSRTSTTTVAALILLCSFLSQSGAFTIPIELKSTSLTELRTTLLPSAQRILQQDGLSARKRSRYDDEYDDDNDYYYSDDGGYVDDDDYYEYQQRRRRRPPQRTNLDESPELSSSFLPSFPNPFSNDNNNNIEPQSSGMKLPSTVSQSLLAGTFVLGIGTGVTVDSQINTSPKDLASRDAVDQAAPNPTLCTTYGASAMAFDQRVFVSFNPFNVYVAQADVKPACVLRQANVVPVLQDRGLINKKEVKQCKDNMSNTWAFVGDLNDYPQLSCVYRSEDAQNEFLSNPKLGIGEDVYDDDREMMRKSIKTGLTEGEKAVLKAKAAALKLEKDSVDL